MKIQIGLFSIFLLLDIIINFLVFTETKVFMKAFSVHKKEWDCHLEYPGDVARSSTTVSKFNYFLPGGIRQRSAINKHTTKLVYATVTYMETKAPELSNHVAAPLEIYDKANSFQIMVSRMI